MINERVEVMSDVFTKYHFEVGKFPITLHYFTGPDTGDAHDHPYPFITTIVKGCYIEEIWSRRNNGVWYRRVIRRSEGTSHKVAQNCIHRIISLPEGECITSVRWQDNKPRVEPRFYRLMNGVMQSRQWDQSYEQL